MSYLKYLKNFIQYLFNLFADYFNSQFSDFLKLVDLGYLQTDDLLLRKLGLIEKVNLWKYSQKVYYLLGLQRVGQDHFKFLKLLFKSFHHFLNLEFQFYQLFYRTRKRKDSVGLKDYFNFEYFIEIISYFNLKDLKLVHFV